MPDSDSSVSPEPKAPGPKAPGPKAKARGKAKAKPHGPKHDEGGEQASNLLVDKEIASDDTYMRTFSSILWYGE